MEVCKISDDDADRRKGLLSFLYRLAADVRPLEVPNEHLINLAKGYHNGDSSGTASVGQKTEALWHILQAPGLLVKHGPEYFTAWSGENEDGLLEAHAEARPHLQRIYSGGAIRPTSAAKCIKAFLADRRELTDFLSPMYEYSTGTPIEGNAIEKFLDAVPAWKLYICGWIHSAYRRAVQTENWGKRTNPGIMDLLCAVYLPLCEVFVTHDTAQRRALRLLACLSPNRPRVQSWVDFRRRLRVFEKREN